jgi:multiple sugar transport system substrate-binding protein
LADAIVMHWLHLSSSYRNRSNVLKTAISLVFFLFSVITVFGTGQQDGAEATETKNVDVWMRGAPPGLSEIMRAEIVPRFEADRPGVKIEYRPLTWKEGYPAVQAAIAAGNPPDMMVLGRPTSVVYAAQGALLDLTEYFANWDLKDDFYPILEWDTWEGKLIGLPFFVDTRVAMYNKAIFEEVGLDPENPPQTWKDFSDAAVRTTIRNPQGIVTRAGFDSAILDGGASHQFYQFLWQNGGDVLSPDYSRSTVNSTEGIETLQFYTDLITKHNVDNLGPWGSPTALGKWQNDEIAIQINHPSVITQAIRESPETVAKFGATLLKRKQNATFVGGQNLTISSETQYPDLLWDFVAYLFEDYHLEILDQYGQIPSRRSIVQEWIDGKPAVYNVFQDGTEFGRNIPPIPKNNLIHEEVNEAVQEVIAGERTAKEALDAAAADIDRRVLGN